MAAGASGGRSRSRRGVSTETRPGIEAQRQAGPGPLCDGCSRTLTPEATLELSCCRRRRSGRARPQPHRHSGPVRRGRRQRQEPAERTEFVFRAPLVLSKAGEVRDEFESQLRQYEDQKEGLKEEDEATEELIQIILAEEETQEMEKKVTEPGKKDEEPSRKWSREFAADNMSDSENEEPAKRVPAANSSPRARALSTSCEKSRSWSTPAGTTGRKAGCCPVLGSGSSTLLNVLSSSENSRSCSAPALSGERAGGGVLGVGAGARPMVGGCTGTGGISRPVGPPRERSGSPDSNDSISEELNHFKPILCSPCTPPKCLADGRLLRPRVVRSTPRNLSRSLHSPTPGTSYPAGQGLLLRWGQLLQDRRDRHSQATLTAPAPRLAQDEPQTGDKRLSQAEARALPEEEEGRQDGLGRRRRKRKPQASGSAQAPAARSRRKRSQNQARGHNPPSAKHRHK
ncbi:E3 ubiquitin-protein ligase RNF169 [Callorhinchus milii]|uniref:E3 ubiquitin-protein ligase RNF169 n=1 Tax=Callorhinchus milii TaxID=7868 RepID=UPI001C3FEDDC|nr:E3 ubiquitin-protein ligase RNF169 [Callorhinchus milii]